MNLHYFKVYVGINIINSCGVYDHNLYCIKHMSLYFQLLDNIYYTEVLYLLKYMQQVSAVSYILVTVYIAYNLKLPCFLHISYHPTT